MSSLSHLIVSIFNSKQFIIWYGIMILLLMSIKRHSYVKECYITFLESSLCYRLYAFSWVSPLICLCWWQSVSYRMFYVLTYCTHTIRNMFKHVPGLHLYKAGGCKQSPVEAMAWAIHIREENLPITTYCTFGTHIQTNLVSIEVLILN